MKKYKGKVGVSTDRGTLRLSLPRFLFSTRKYIYLGLQDTPQNRKLAKAKAQKIESDITYERFDFSLESYLPVRAKSSKENTLVDLYQKYIEAKKNTVRPGTWRNTYQVMLRHIQRSPFSDTDPNIDDGYSQRFYDWAAQYLTPDTCKRLLTQINACLKWAIKSKQIALTHSPFEGFAAQSRSLIKSSKEDETDINPFSRSERDTIIEAFKNHQQFCHYYNYVRFCFFTGCRPSEAMALEWEDIAPNFQSITFKAAMVRGEEGMEKCDGLKTQKKRIFPCNDQVQTILRLTKDRSTTNLVFTSITGKVIEISYFRRIWKKILNELGIEYRKPYQMRHSFITLCLESGVDVKDVARLVGNSPIVIYKHYAGRRVDLSVPDL